MFFLIYSIYQSETTLPLHEMADGFLWEGGRRVRVGWKVDLQLHHP